MHHGDIIDIVQNIALVVLAIWCAMTHGRIRHVQDVAIAAKDAECARLLAENQELKHCLEILQRVYRDKREGEAEGDGA